VFHPELGAKILDQIAEQVTEVGKVETQGRLDGRNMTMVLAPDKKRSTTRKHDDRNTQPAEQPAAQPTPDGDATPAEPVAARTGPAPQPATVSTDIPSA
jgi:translation initiation factor IF-3